MSNLRSVVNPVLTGLVVLLALQLPGSPRSRPGASTEPELADLAWLAGHWASEERGTRTEEVWLAPLGGLMLAVNRTTPKTGRAAFEYLRIEERKDGLVYVASPSGKGATDFPLADVGERFVLFENPAHDFPQRIRYELDAAGALHARVSGDMGGEEQAQEWTWKRAP
jgi:hypothetical protein